MIKEKGYVWGMISVALTSFSAVSPFLGVVCGAISNLPPFLTVIFPLMFVIFPPIGFVFAFIGKVKSGYGTEARKLSNIGAGIAIVMSAILIWSLSMVLLKDLFQQSEMVAAVTGLIDMILITGYFLIAYIRGKVLWFI